ncbi:MAG: NOP58 family protein [Candidatus Micrarchaeota archaeon]|nr:NOP58 family protein [Candidatus Micrarchaeota archaeon]
MAFRASGKPKNRGGRLSREEFFAKAKKKVKAAISSRDNLLVQSVSAVDELNKASNLLFERLTEWYGMHFPEFRASEPKKYVEGVLVLDRKKPDEQALTSVFGPQAQPIMEKMRSSVGAELSDEDLEQLRALARQIKSLWELRDSIESYEAKIAKEVCPNMAHIAGPELAAKLVAQAGGLQRMATFPASTIQVLGAEKALFKHLKSGSRPPKHGLIFQHPLVGKSPKKIRGKIARALAAKLAIACKADALSHNFIADRLKERFEEQARRIMEQQKRVG